MSLNPNGDLPSVLAILRLALLGNSAVTALVARRVFPGHLRPNDPGAQTFPLIVLNEVSGDLDQHDVVQDLTVEVYGYSRLSSEQAMQVYGAAKAVLQQEILTMTGFDLAALCWESSRPEPGWNEQVQAWYARGYFRVQAIG